MNEVNSGWRLAVRPNGLRFLLLQSAFTRSNERAATAVRTQGFAFEIYSLTANR